MGTKTGCVAAHMRAAASLVVKPGEENKRELRRDCLQLQTASFGLGEEGDGQKRRTNFDSLNIVISDGLKRVKKVIH